jgi:hydroxymethylpyrimidine pyrophosphatase-like HAD family hydrolase
MFAGDPSRDSAAVRQYHGLRGPLVRVDDAELGAVKHVLSVAALSDELDLAPLRDRAALIAHTSTLLTELHLVKCEALEVFNGGCSKARAVAHIAEAHGIAMDQVMAIGDGLNDCELLAAVGLGVAMGNACEEAIKQARVQVGRNDEDGVAEAIDRLVLGR